MPETTYTPELAADICRRVSEGEPLRQVCRDQGMPPESTVRQWARDDRDGFGTAYQQARQMQVDAWADEIVDISNRDDLDPHDKRVRIDTRKWLMSKLAPKRYGERLLVAGDAENPLQVLHSQVSLDKLGAAELEELEAFTDRILAARRQH